MLISFVHQVHYLFVQGREEERERRRDGEKVDGGGEVVGGGRKVHVHLLGGLVPLQSQAVKFVFILNILHVFHYTLPSSTW